MPTRSHGADASKYLIRTHDDPHGVAAAQWDDLLSMQASPTPFLRHAFLAALHDSGSAVARTGWQPLWLTVHRGDVLVGGCALYAKSHSYGEYVFDWSWANAYERHGRPYYPKLLCAVPFTPVPGARLLARDDEARDALIAGLVAVAKNGGLSSVHVLFPDAIDALALERQGWSMRAGVQFHWQQDREKPWTGFDEFLASMHRDKRKKIAQERRRVREAGVTFRTLEGPAIDAQAWDFFYLCYARTYAEHGSLPYLERSFFEVTAKTMPECWVMFVASREGRDIGASLLCVDTERRVAYGRYWGAIEHVPLMHFEACYYQGIAWCIERGFARFEGGAQGEHKMARGLLPVSTCSAHWIADRRFASAIDDFLHREGAGVHAYVGELNDRSPFKARSDDPV
jgi:uncharacterized protein